MKIFIHRVIVFFVASSLFLGVTLFGGATLASQPDVEVDEESNVVRQDENAAEAADIAILASATNLPMKRVEEAIAFQQVFAKYADELIIRFPDQISAIWTEPVPNRRGHIQFTGEVPSGVTSKNIVLTGGGMISMADHARRAELVAAALTNLGHQNFVTFFDPIEKVIRIEFQLSETASQPNKLDLVDAVRERVQADRDQSGKPRLRGRAATVDARDLELTVITSSGPILKLLHSRGGNWLRDDGVRECTSGWSVSGPNGDGIITAGHCFGLNQFEQPGVTLYSMIWRNQVFGSGGDVEYHTTTSHLVPAEFYADATNIRSVTGIKPTSTMVGNSVCVYGRESNVRTCNHIVEAVGVTVDAGSGVLIGNQVRTDSSGPLTGGDSGGGWSWSNTAWGVTTGVDSNGRGYFTPVQQAQTALNVTIKTK